MPWPPPNLSRHPKSGAGIPARVGKEPPPGPDRPDCGGGPAAGGGARGRASRPFAASGMRSGRPGQVAQDARGYPLPAWPNALPGLYGRSWRGATPYTRHHSSQHNSLPTLVDSQPRGSLRLGRRSDHCCGGQRFTCSRTLRNLVASRPFAPRVSAEVEGVQYWRR